jgi:hypothetical protein
MAFADKPQVELETKLSVPLRKKRTWLLKGERWME